MCGLEGERLCFVYARVAVCRGEMRHAGYTLGRAVGHWDTGTLGSGWRREEEGA